MRRSKLAYGPLVRQLWCNVTRLTHRQNVLVLGVARISLADRARARGPQPAFLQLQDASSLCIDEAMHEGTMGGSNYCDLSRV